MVIRPISTLLIEANSVKTITNKATLKTAAAPFSFKCKLYNLQLIKRFYLKVDDRCKIRRGCKYILVKYPYQLIRKTRGPLAVLRRNRCPLFFFFLKDDEMLLIKKKKNIFGLLTRLYSSEFETIYLVLHILLFFNSFQCSFTV